MKMCSCRQLCEVCWRRSGRWEQLSFVVCLLWVNEFKTCFLQPHPALQSQERGGGGGPGLWARDSWTNRGNRERERGRRGREPCLFLWVCHVIWTNPFISGGRGLFGPSGCWVSVTDEKKWAVSAGIWGRPRAKAEPAWRRGRRSGSALDWLAEIKRSSRPKF